MAAWEKRDKTKKSNCEEGRQERREEKATTALEAGLKGAGGGASGAVPGKQRTGEKGQSLDARRQERGRHQAPTG